MRHSNSERARTFCGVVIAWAIALAPLSFCGTASATIYYVKRTGNNGHPGTSWATAKLTIQAAIDAASVPGDEVWVAAGVYRENLLMRNINTVYGGFAGVETTRDERNWHLHETVVDAGRHGRPVTFLNSSDATAGIDGFTLTGGLVPVGSSGTDGGAIYGTGRAVIANNRISGNIATNGAGIYWGSFTSPTIVGNVIIGNAARAYGGGALVIGYFATIANNVVAFNSAVGYGGGLFVESATISNNTIVGNGSLGPAYACGIWVNGGVTNRISNNIIALNSSGVGVQAGVNKPAMTRNCVFANLRFDYVNITATGSDIHVDPRFADWYMGDFHIMPDSPCIDMGDDARVIAGRPDMDGEARTSGAHVDIGADEQSATPTAPPVVQVVFVSPTGSDANDGRSWSQARRTINGGIAAARGGDHVWVAQGIYPETVDVFLPMSVYGGFAGGETNVGQRDPVANSTVIDGEGVRTCVNTQITTAMPTLVSGFVIQNGFSTGAWAGGVNCQGSPTIIGNVVRLCTGTHGGGITNQGGAPTISNNIVMGNIATATGGGIYLQDSIGAWVEGNVVARNRCLAGSGGGISSANGSVWLVNNTVAENVSDAAGSAGGIDTASPLGQALIANNIVAYNSSGIMDSAGGAEQLLNNCVFGNIAYDYSGLAPGATDISVDPGFVNRAAADYHVVGASPCVDGGADAYAPTFWTDPEGRPRVLAAHVDIGAYEKPTVLVWVPDRTGVPGLTTDLKAYLRGIPDGSMLGGKTVGFLVAGTSVGAAISDAGGRAVLSWIVTPGAEVRPIVAEFGGDAGYGPGSGSASLTTHVLATIVDVPDVARRIRESALVTSTLRRADTGAPIAGEQLTTTIDGTEAASGPTDLYGRLRFGYLIPDGAGAGSRVIETTYAGSVGYLASIGAGSLNVGLARTYLWTYARTSVRGANTTLRALLRSLPDYQPIAGRDVAFTVDGTLIGTAPTNTNGWANVIWSVPLGEPVGPHSLGAQFAGDAWFEPATASGSLDVI